MNSTSNTTMEYVIGQEYKITGGKYKTYKSGVLVKFSATYSTMKVNLSGTEIKEVKVKNCYIHPKHSNVIEMPDVSNLMPVQGNPDDVITMNDLTPDEQDLMEKVEAMVNQQSETDIHITETCDTTITQQDFDNHWMSECHVALAERDQADEKVNEQDDQIIKLTKRNKYLEEIVRKLLLP